MNTIVIQGVEYELASTLRVAYRVQGQHAHKPYTEVFSGIGEMPLEDQIGILYEAFYCANPQAAKSVTRQQFLDSYLDTYTVAELMTQLKAVIQGIMGVDETEASAENPPTAPVKA